MPNLLKRKNELIAFSIILGLLLVILGLIITPSFLNNYLTLEGGFELTSIVHKLRFASIASGLLFLIFGFLVTKKPSFLSAASKQLSKINSPNKVKFAFALTIIFILICSFIALRHEMWRDEMQAWLIATESGSPIELIQNLKYEGHPGVWHLSLFTLSGIVDSVWIMKVLHLAIASLAVFLIARYSPFSRFQKLFLVLGYLFIYQYSIIARNYAPGMLLIFAFCSFFPSRKKRFPLLAFLLLLLAHTSVHALIIVLALTGSLIISFYLSGWPSKGKSFIGFALILFGIATAIIQLNPPPDSGVASGWNLGFNLSRAAVTSSTPAEAFFPLPFNFLHLLSFTPFNSLTGALFYTAGIIVSLSLVAYISLKLLRKPPALTAFLVGTFGLLLFFYTKFQGTAMRFNGFIFILFLASIWISADCRRIDGLKGIRVLNGKKVKEKLHLLLVIILISHLFAGAYAVSMDIVYPFSRGKDVANFIKKKGWSNLPIVGDKDFAMTTVAGYLGREIYFPRGDRWGSYVVWDEKRLEEVSGKEIVDKALELSKQKGSACLVVLNYPFPKEILKNHPLTLVKKFKKAIVQDETYYLYKTAEP